MAGTTAEARIQGGETHSYRLSLKADQYAGLVVDQRGADVAVTLHDPEGRLLASVDSLQGARVPEQVPVIATAAGTYRVEVSVSEREGSYAVRIDALRPATREDRTRVRAERLLSQAEKLQSRDDRSSRETAAARAREAAGLFADPSRAADAFYALGNALYLLDDNAGAQEAYGRALALFRETGRERETGKALNGLGRSWRQEEPGRALALYREALALYRRLGERQQEATSLQNLGRIHHSLGETEEALVHYERALAIWRELGVRSQEAGTLLSLGDLYQSLGEPRKALDLLPRAIALFEAEGSSGDAASALTTLGDAQFRAGRIREALASHTRALAIHRRNGNRREEALALNSIGCCHLLLGRPGEARRSLAEARSIFRRIGDRSSEAVALVNLGLADEQNPRQAIAAFSAAMPALISRDYEALALLGLARAHRRLGDLASARKEAEAAIERIESLRGKSAGLGMRASFLASRQDFYSFYVDLLMDLHHRE
ncbi:MAG TPA: tetratricopeptide repeat protein, partial [Thermoanaerobaculia bacterium]